MDCHLNIKSTLLKVVILACLCLVSCLDRKLTITKNPGCDQDCDKAILIYVRADSANDSLHYLWDFTGKPSALLALTSLKANLSVSWYQFIWDPKDISISFTETPAYSFGVVIDKILEFNDLNDTGSITSVNKENITSISTNEFTWELIELDIQNSSSILRMKSRDGPRNGSIEITVTSSGSREHGQQLPHLFHSSNSSQLDIVINNLERHPNYTCSRFAFELIFLSQEKEGNKTFKILTRKSLDDEHTPGVFTINDLVSPSAYESDMGGGWLLWRRVSYTSDSRDINNSTEIKDYSLEDVSDHSLALNGTLLHAFYGYNVDNYLVQSTKISFGETQDGFYAKYNYTTWTLLVGYGYPLEDEFSLLVILVISIGLGVPIMLILIGGIYLLIRGFSSNKDELFLSR